MLAGPVRACRSLEIDALAAARSARAFDARRADAGRAHRHHHVLERGQRRDEVERLEHDADGVAPVLGERRALRAR